MSPVLRIILGLVVMVIGFVVVWKTRKFLTWFGRVPFAEQKFGPGGTEFFYKLIGIGLAFIGIFIATNIISDILGSFASIFTR
jgi:hypothetical protein